MSAAYVVTAPLVQALVDAEAGVYTHIYQGGILPSTVDKDQLRMLVADGMVEKRDLAEAEPADDGEWKGPKGVNIDDVLAYVGDDADRAADVLDQEGAADKPRKKLVEALEKIIDPSTD